MAGECTDGTCQGWQFEGIVLFGETVGVDEYRDVGHTDAFSITVATEKRSFASKRPNTYGQDACAKYVTQPTEFSLMLRSCNKENIKLAFLGDATDINITADSVTDGDITSANGKSIPIGHRNITNYVLSLEDIATHAGNVDLSSGFDWTTTAQDFNINVDGAGVTNVALNTLTTDVTTTVAEINAELTTAALNTVVEAYDAGTNFVGIRKLVAGGDFVLTAGTTDALATLGWTAATYEGTTAYVEDTDYCIDAKFGFLKTLVSGSITDATALKHSFDYPARTGYIVDGVKRGSVTIPIKLLGTNTASGEEVEVTIPSAVISSGTELDFMNDEFIELSLAGSATINNGTTFTVEATSTT